MALLPTDAAALETPLAAVEARLAGLAEALRERDTLAIDAEAAALHHSLAAAVDHFAAAARAGALPPALRHRLALAGGKVAAHREALARATASLDRAIDVLLPGAGSVYSASGATQRPASAGALLAS